MLLYVPDMNSAVTMSAPSIDPDVASPMPMPTHAAVSERVAASEKMRPSLMELRGRSTLWCNVAWDESVMGPLE